EARGQVDARGNEVGDVALLVEDGQDADVDVDDAVAHGPGGAVAADRMAQGGGDDVLPDHGAFRLTVFPPGSFGEVFPEHLVERDPDHGESGGVDLQHLPDGTEQDDKGEDAVEH